MQNDELSALDVVGFGGIGGLILGNNLSTHCGMSFMSVRGKDAILGTIAVLVTGVCSAYIATGMDENPPVQRQSSVRSDAGLLHQSGIHAGQRFPDITIYDESGQRFQLSGRSKYAVVVFGCLT